MVNQNKTNAVIINDKSYEGLSLKELLGDVADISLTCVPYQGVKTTLELIKKNCPDLIVVNISPKSNWGVLLCGELKKDPEVSYVPVVFVTNDKCPINFEKIAFVYGCIDHLSESMCTKDVVEKLKYYSNFGKIGRGLKGVMDKLSKEKTTNVC